jgi:TatA/E family protein of Tat protein translocase
MSFSLGFIEGIGGPELAMIMFVVLLLFGAQRLPELARGLGKSVREFKKAASGVESEVRRAMEEEPAKPAPKPAGTVQQAAPEKPAPPEATD